MQTYLPLLLMLFFPLPGRAQLGYQIGDTVQAFSLPDTDSIMIHPMESRPASRGMVLVFGGNGCLYSQAYEKRLLAMDSQFSALGFDLFLINPSPLPGEDQTEMREQALQANYTFAYLKDEQQTVARAFGVSRLPQAFVLQRSAESRYVLRYIGAIDNQPEADGLIGQSYLQEAVEALSQGQMPVISYTRAMGCSLQWRQ